MPEIGFTGTRKGLTLDQRETVRDILAHFFVPDTGCEFHHGNCIGADEQALEIARAIGYWIVAHPAKELDKYQLDIFTFASDEARNYKLPLRRNKDIVNETDYLIACPNEHSEPKPARGQGTWSTVRYARNCRYGYPFVIVWPDGTFVEEGAE